MNHRHQRNGERLKSSEHGNWNIPKLIFLVSVMAMVVIGIYYAFH